MNQQEVEEHIDIDNIDNIDDIDNIDIQEIEEQMLRIVKKRSLSEFNEKIRELRYYQDCLHYHRLPIIYQLCSSIDSMTTFYHIANMIHNRILSSMTQLFFRFQDNTLRETHIQLWGDGIHYFEELPTIMGQITSKNHWLLYNYANHFLPDICNTCHILPSEQGIIQDMFLRISFDIIQHIQQLFSKLSYNIHLIELISTFIIV
tara:strand:+ start:95 stop:706 length:612 start_codon:yes stop_codon:yes gene_type:complete